MGLKPEIVEKVLVFIVMVFAKKILWPSICFSQHLQSNKMQMWLHVIASIFLSPGRCKSFGWYCDLPWSCFHEANHWERVWNNGCASFNCKQRRSIEVIGFVQHLITFIKNCCYCASRNEKGPSEGTKRPLARSKGPFYRGKRASLATIF